MLLLDGALALMIVLTGTAMLGAHHLLLLLAGVAAGIIALLITYGHVVRRRRDPRREPARVGGPLDVVPAEPLAVAPMDGRTATSVILGAMGLFVFNAVFGAFALGLGLATLRRGAPGRWARPGAIAGVLLGVADYVVLLLMIATRLTGAGFHWS
jgi:hypothetical protein